MLARLAISGRWIQAAIGIGLLILAAAVRLADPAPVELLRLTTFDTLQRLQPRQATPLPVRVIDIDEASLAEYGQWPWPRDRLAQMVDTLRDYGAASVAFDVIFAEPDRMSPATLFQREDLAALLPDGMDQGLVAAMDNDARFARALGTMPVALGIADVAVGTQTPVAARVGVVEIGQSPALGLVPMRGTTPIVPVLAQAATGIASISVSPGATLDVVRRVPMLWRSDTGPMPSLALEALRLALGETTLQIHGIANLEGGVQFLRLADFSIPTTPSGEVWLRARPDDPALYLSAATLLKAPDDPSQADPALVDKLAGNIVFVGTSAAGLLDIRTTPLGEAVPGVSIHAQILEQILTGEFLTRNELVQGSELLAFLILGLVVVGLATRVGPLASMIAGGAAGGILVAASWLAFTRAGILIDATFPLLGGLLAFGGMSAWQFIVVDREKRLIRRSFSHYVAPAVLTQIEQSGHDLKLGGETRDLSIMFCDIRDFTPLSETMTAPELVDVLNTLFDDLGAEILNQRGTIDKFIGDAIMAFWNAPLVTRGHQAGACRAALSMRHALAGFNAKRGGKPIATCVGINTGTACVGNIGSRDRYNYSVVGDAVNVAARIEAACRPIGYDIVVADETAQAAPGLAFLPAGAIELKGKSNRISVQILVGDADCAAGDDFRALAARHAALIDDLAAGREVAQTCAKLAEIGIAIEPGLRTFYAALAARRADFESR